MASESVYPSCRVCLREDAAITLLYCADCDEELQEGEHCQKCGKCHLSCVWCFATWAASPQESSQARQAETLLLSRAGV